jgi:hypothetical protein
MIMWPVVVILYVFGMHGTNPDRPHEVMRFATLQDCTNARQHFLDFSDNRHGYECLTGVVVNGK